MNHEVKVTLRAGKRNEFYQILSKIAILLSDIKGQAYEKAITNSLKLIGEFVKADRTYIYDFKKNTCSNVHEYCKEGISSVLANLQDILLAKIPIWVDAHQKNETVEVYDALRSERPYKKAFSYEETVMIIKKDLCSHFDPDIVEAFLRIQDQFDAIYNSMSK